MTFDSEYVKDVLGALFLFLLMASIWAVNWATTELSVHPSHPVRLIGLCDGVLHGAQQEDQFPKDCDWIEPLEDLD